MPLFDRINSRRRGITTMQAFAVRVTAGDVNEVAIAKILAANGLHVGATQRNAKAVSSVAALLAVYREHDSETLDVTIKVIMNTWGINSALNAALLRGYG